MSIYYGEFILFIIFTYFFFWLTKKLALDSSDRDDTWEDSYVPHRSILVGGIGLAFFLRDLAQLQVMVRLGLAANWFGDYNNYIDVSSTSGSVFLIWWHWMYGNSDTFKKITAIVSILVWFKVLGFLKSFSQPIATFVLMINQVILDLRSFLVVLLVVILMFGHAFYVLLSDNDPDNPFKSFGLRVNETEGETLSTLYLTLLGDFDMDAYKMKNDPNDPFASWLFFLFSFIVMIILLNVLIAIVSDSYDMVLVNSSELFWRSRLELVAEITTTFGHVMGENRCFTWFKKWMKEWAKKVEGWLKTTHAGTGMGHAMLMGYDDDHWLSNRNKPWLGRVRTFLCPLMYAIQIVYTAYLLLMLLLRWMVNKVRSR